MLDYVEDGKPKWKDVAKATPHYLGELGSIVEDNVVAYKNFRIYKKANGELLYPTDGEWKEAHKAYETEKQGTASGYTMVDYGTVPSYDLIVRPTYTEATTGTNVMYDEATTSADGNNQITFELTLENGLEYEKTYTFDLNANQETVVFLRVTPERIDYKSAGARKWKESSYSDNYYGVNNQNGNNLSTAGSSWQRAYTNDSLKVGVTDGHLYDADAEDDSAQYVSNAKWVSMLLQAYKGGVHHGDYFILKNDITINTDDYTFPADFTFTGHLDAQDKTITITGSRAYLFDGLNGTYTTAQESDKTKPWEANVHLEGTTWVPTTGWRAEVVNTKISGACLFKDGATITGYVNNCTDANGAVKNNTPTLPTY
jgi:predicted phosphodiesterase